MEDERMILDSGDKEDKVILYISRYNEYAIPIRDYNSYICIEYCPWCGKKFQRSLRDEWFERLEKIGILNPLSRDDYPEKFKSWEWWKKD